MAPEAPSTFLAAKGGGCACTVGVPWSTNFLQSVRISDPSPLEATMILRPLKMISLKNQSSLSAPMGDFKMIAGARLL